MNGTYTICNTVPNGGYLSQGVTLPNSGSGYYYTPTMNGTYAPVTNTGTIYTSTSVGTWVNSTGTNTNTLSLTISGGDGALLTIDADGTVTWKGSLTQNAKALVNAIGYNIDKVTAGEQAMAKSYRKAVERCLRQIKTMSKEDFIEMLEQEVKTRLSKAVWQELSTADEIVSE